MTPWEKAEAKLLYTKSGELASKLTKMQKKYKARGIKLKMIVDNDCWHLQPTNSAQWTDEIGDDLMTVSKGVLDVGPEELACLLAIMLGFDAGRP